MYRKLQLQENIQPTPVMSIVTDTKVNAEDEIRIQAIKKVSPAIVLITNTGIGTGSGIIYRSDTSGTYIVTNAHVILGQNVYTVTFEDGQNKTATLRGLDVLSDLAVIRIKDYQSPVVAEFAKTDNIEIGQSVIAIGSPLGMDYINSATQGIVSGKNRLLESDFNNDGVADYKSSVLQTDAAVNPGNSGGALITLNGEVIGITSSKLVELGV